jgi:AbrB family looped-hinge helix DNA binding protein
MRITSKGQVTIPLDIREQLGLIPGTEVDFAIDGQGVRLIKAKRSKRSIGRAIVEHMRGRGTGTMTTDQLMKLLRD